MTGAALLVRLVIGLSLFPYALQKIMNTQNAAHFPQSARFFPTSGILAGHVCGNHGFDLHNFGILLPELWQLPALSTWEWQ